MSTNWKMKGRLYGVVLVALSFVHANAYPTVSPALASDKDPVIDYDSEDAGMEQAQETARLHLEAFMNRFIGEDGLAPEIAAVKVAIPVDGEKNEIIWVSPFGRSAKKRE